MLGLPVNSWMRFYLCGFVAGLLLCSVRFGPMLALGIFEMILAVCGILVVAMYTRYYLPRQWRRWLVSVRRILRVALRPAPPQLHNTAGHRHLSA